MYKCAILGCRGRARAHARAYENVKGGKLAAICDMKEELLNGFGDEFGIDTRYTDLDEMLSKEKPDLLHIVTAPVMRGTNERIRYPLLNQASEHGVPAIIIEKPIAVESEDWRQIHELSKRTKTKVAINTQLNFHPKNLELKRDVAEGKIGAIKFIEASARNPPVDQAPHVLQLVSSYIDNSQPAKVMGQIAGVGNLDGAQPSPSNATGIVTYQNGVQASVAFGPEMAPKVSESKGNNQHKRVCVFGEKGFVHWRFNGWDRYTPDDGFESGNHGYGGENAVAQTNLTEAMFDWLDDESKVHPTNLPQSLAEFNLLLGIYYSGLSNSVIDLPFDPPDGLIDMFRERL